MSNPFDDLPEQPEDGEPEEEFEPDVATVAFLDQQQAEFENTEAEFEAFYGFKHECHCAEDYAAGRVGEITQCYHNMLQTAMATCARLTAENKEIASIAQALYEELRSRIEAEEGSGKVSDESEPEPASSEAGDSEPAPESDTDGGEAPELGEVDDGAGEGFGVAGEVVREATDSDPNPGTPDDRKLV